MLGKYGNLVRTVSVHSYKTFMWTPKAPIKKKKNGVCHGKRVPVAFLCVMALKMRPLWLVQVSNTARSISKLSNCCVTKYKLYLSLNIFMDRQNSANIKKCSSGSVCTLPSIQSTDHQIVKWIWSKFQDKNSKQPWYLNNLGKYGNDKSTLTLYMLGNFACFLSSVCVCLFFNLTFS